MIQIRKVSKIYRTSSDKQVRALEEINLDIQEGEFVAVVGPSGSGKSTLMNILGLLDQPSDGSYVLDSQEVSWLSLDALASLRNRKIGFVFQSFHLLPRTSAVENVELPLIYSDRTDLRAAAEKALASVGLSDRMSHHSGELSGGEQQRVAIARALVNEPDVILADEPTGNLDSRAGLEVMAIFQKLHAAGKTIVLVTHDRDLANHTGRIIRLSDGRVVKEQPVASPRHAETLLKDLPAEPDSPGDKP